MENKVTYDFDEDKEEDQKDGNDKVLEHVVNSYKKLEKLNSKYKKRFDALIKGWGEFKHKTDYKWQSKAFYPKCYEQVETVFSRIWNKDIKIKLSDQTAKNPDKAHKAELLLNHQREIGDYRKVDAQAIKNGLICGKGIYRLGWCMKTNTNVNEDNGEIIEEKVSAYEYPSIQAIDPRNVFIDPEFSSGNPIQDAPCVIIRNVYAINELEREGVYDLENIPPFEEGGDCKLSSEDRKRLINSDEFSGMYVELIEYYGLIKEDGEYKEKIISVANRKKIIRIEENEIGMRPLADFSVSIDPTCYWSKGIVEPTVGMQAEYNFLMNGVMDSITMSLLGMFFLDPNANIDSNDIEIEPGAVHTLRPEDFKRETWETPSLMGVVGLANKISDDLQSTPGTTDYAKGTNQPGMVDTATGISILSENAGMRFETIVENYKETHDDIARIMIRLNKKYLDTSVLVKPEKKPKNMKDSEYVSVKDYWSDEYTDYIKINKDDLNDYLVSIEIAGEGVSNAQANRDKAEQIRGLVQQFPDQFNVTEVIKRVLNSLEVEDEDSLLAGFQESPMKDAKRLEDALTEYQSTQDPQKKQEVLDLYEQLNAKAGQQGGAGNAAPTSIQQPGMVGAGRIPVQ